MQHFLKIDKKDCPAKSRDEDPDPDPVGSVDFWPVGSYL